MKVIVGLAWMVFGCVAAGSGAEAAGPAYPPTAKRPVSDTYQGVVVSDDYRWLEDGSAADVKAWIAAQNQFARAYLDAIPQRPEIARRVSELLRARAVRRFAFELRGQLFALKNAPPNNQAQLVVMPRNGDVAKERVVVDPLRIDPKGGTAIDFYRASYDGKHVVVSLSENGSEDGTAYVYEVATGKRLPDRVPGVNFPTAGGSFEWAPDGSGFYYTRYPREGERPAADRHFYQTVWFHTLGTPPERRPLRDRARLSADCGNSPFGKSQRPIPARRGRQRRRRRDRVSFARQRRAVDAGRRFQRRRQAHGIRRRRAAVRDVDQGRRARPCHRDPARGAVAGQGFGSRPRRRTWCRSGDPDQDTALCPLPRWRTLRHAHLHARRQAPARSAGRAFVRDFHRYAAFR